MMVVIVMIVSKLGSTTITPISLFLESVNLNIGPLVG